MLIYLVRHALADLTTGMPYQIAPGPPLSVEGQAQAEEAARVLEFSGASRVVSSPMRRCVATAEPMCARLGLDLLTDEDLGEVQPGESLPAMSLRMLRAVFTHSNTASTVFVSHSAPLEQLILALTRGTAILSPPDTRGARIGAAHVWQLDLREGQWQARHLRVGGVLV
ncbi:MAG: histidine phosphatase family protein [Chloroflexota bacterium]|nr:histidine phosphatase family protein [Chloroflexota bacterium]